MTETLSPANAAQVVGELGEGPPVVVLAGGLVNAEALRGLARRFRLVVVEAAGGPDGAGATLTAWLAGSGLEGFGVLGAGDLAPAALAAATAAGARSLVLLSPRGLAAPPTPSPPTAVLIGDRDPDQPRDALSLYRRLLPGCRTVLVHGAGADIAADRPEAFAAAAGDFLDRQGRFNLMTESVALD